MLTSKERAYLRGLAQNIDPVVQLGKGEIDEDVMFAINGVLDTRELIKISILQNSELEPKVVADELADCLKAQVVAVIGRKIVLYRKSTKKGVKHIEINGQRKK